MLGSRLNDRYEITAELGRGGMGVVYKARDPLLNRDVAVKLIPPALLSPEAEQRFQREAQVVAQMDHPSIVSIHDLGRHEGSLFFVMPLVQGTNLHQFRRMRSALGDIVDIGIQIAEALDYSHAQGVVHRDIKPENVMVAEEAGGVRVRVMDFGLARASTETRLTKTGALVGTLAYLSPEQVAARAIDGRSDIYSLGVVLYECVAGSPPFQGDTQSVLYRIVHEVPRSPRSLGADIDEELEGIILSCLQKEPAKRPARAGDVAEALRRYRARLRDSDRKRPLTALTLTTPRPVLAPFVGRTKEFTELQHRLNAALDGECQFVVVGGEPGIGKTRLVDELVALARVRQLRVLRGRSVEQDRSLPYQGFCELVQDYFRQAESAGSGNPAETPDLSDLAGELVALFPMLNEIPEIRAKVGSDPRLMPSGPRAPEDKTQVFELLARTLTRLGHGQPLVLVLEDLHGAEVSVEALPYVVRRLGPTPTLVVGSYRTTDVGRAHPLTRMLDSFAGDPRFAHLELGPLSASDHRQLVETLVAGAGVSGDLASRLFTGSEGNPFFTKELVRSLLDSGGLTRSETGEWALSGATELSAEAMPATIQQVVEKRIVGLPADQRDLLAVASIIGRSFDAREVEALAEGRESDETIDRLIQQGLIEEVRESRGDRLSFSSGVVRDVLYGGLSRRKRRSLHQRYAEMLEKRHGGRQERVLPLLVHHFSQGDVPEKTVEYGLQLARKSLDSFSAEEAARATRMALEFLDDQWEGDRSLEGEARVLLARAHRMAGDVDGALREAEAAVQVFEQEKQAGRAVDALVLAAEAAWQGRRTDETARWVEKGLRAARAAGETESLRQLLSLAATLANLRGDYARANEHLKEAARLAPELRSAEREEEIPHGGRLVVALADPVAAREPHAIRVIEEEEVLANVFETLVVTDTEGRVGPALCESWEAGEGGRSFVLRLRPDVRFQDGHALAAGDVKSSFERSILEGAGEPPAAAFVAIEGMQEYVDRKSGELAGLKLRSERELEIRLAEPLPIYPALLSHQRTAVVRVPDGGLAPVGTGPFRVASHDGQRVVLERNPDYWKGVTPPLDAIEFRSGLKAAAIAAGLRSGEFDVARDLQPQDLEDLLRDPRFHNGLVEASKENTYFVLFNARCGPVARNPEARRALSAVLSTRDLVWRTLGRFAQPAVCLIPPGMLGHDPGRKKPTLRREEALKLLRDAGIQPGARLNALVHPLVQDRYGSLLTTLVATWAELEVQLDVRNASMGEYLAGFKDNEGLDLMIGRWNADYDDPDNFTHALFSSRSGRWRTWYCSPQADTLLDEARGEVRPAVRETLYRRFEALLQEAAAVAPLFHDIDYRLASPRVRNLRLRGTAPYVNYPQIGKAEQAPVLEEAEAAGGGIVQVPMAGAPSHFDPPRANLYQQVEIIPSVFETLIVDGGGARFVPWLAAQYEAEEGGRRYRFHLRDGVRFHDGRRLTARDVRYSFERLLQVGGENAWQFSAIRGAKPLMSGEAGDLEGFRIRSAREFVIELEGPVAYFPALLSFPVAAILPEGTDASLGPESYVGTGPFRVAAFEPGRRIALERNRHYWRRGFPRCAGVVFHFGVTPGEVLEGFRQGRFSLAEGLFPTEVEALRRDPEFASGYREAPRLQTYLVGFNSRRGPLSDRDLRRALVAAVDVPPLVQRHLGRLATPARGFTPPGLLGHSAGSGTRGAAFASGAAERPAGEVELTAAVNPLFFESLAALAEELWRAWAKLGIKVRVVNRTLDEMADATSKGTVDLYLGRWNADYPDPDNFACQLHSEWGFLGRMCTAPEVDRLVERARAETEPAVRHSLYREVEEAIARDALLLPLFHEQAYRFARPEVEGLSVAFGVPTVAYDRLRVRERQV
jgi:ABC-type transport system substrate-binding protein/predicted ATPase